MTHDFNNHTKLSKKITTGFAMNFKKILILYCIFLLSACSATIDADDPGSSTDAMVSSLETKQEKQEFLKSLAIVLNYYAVYGYSETDLLQEIDGFSVEEINELANNIKKGKQGAPEIF